jgi:uncharacterized membrane protein
MNTNQTSLFQTIIKWFVPIAAIIAFGAWMYISPEGALGKLDAIGYAVCHRIDERSFHIDDRQLPLCARCTGEFYAAGAALIFQAFVSGKRSKLPSRGIIAVLVLFFLAFGIDGSNSYLYLLKQSSNGALEQIPNLYVPNNILRLFTGSQAWALHSQRSCTPLSTNPSGANWMTARARMEIFWNSRRVDRRH